jgi:hypothetical protein
MDIVRVLAVGCGLGIADALHCLLERWQKLQLYFPLLAVVLFFRNCVLLEINPQSITITYIVFGFINFL